MPASPDLTLVGGLIITLCGLVVLVVVAAWLLAPFMLYAIHSRLAETNALLRYLATRPPATEYPTQDAGTVRPSDPTQETGTPPPTFQLLR